MIKTFKDHIDNSVRVTGYHGTNADVDKFKGLSYFSSDKDAAMGYARGKVNIHKTGSPRVYEADIHFKNPHIVDSMQQIGSIDHKAAQMLRDKGHDGVVYKGNKKEPIPEYLPLHPEHISIKKVHND